MSYLIIKNGKLFKITEEEMIIDVKTEIAKAELAVEEANKQLKTLKELNVIKDAEASKLISK